MLKVRFSCLNSLHSSHICSTCSDLWPLYFWCLFPPCSFRKNILHRVHDHNVFHLLHREPGHAGTMFKMYILVCIHKCLSWNAVSPSLGVFISLCSEGCWLIGSADEHISYKLQERQTTCLSAVTKKKCYIFHKKKKHRHKLQQGHKAQGVFSLA